MTLDTSNDSKLTTNKTSVVDELFMRSTSEIIIEESLNNKLNEKKLRIKMGCDPTKPDLHLGHLVGLRLLRKFQEMGHTIVFIVGDYTTKIGDPSGRNTARPVLQDEEIKKNAETYFHQVGQILDMDKTEVVANSQWFAKLNLGELITLAGKFTLAQIIERDDFQKRLKDGRDIGLHEILYPLMQAYDSVVTKADVEIGGTDQKFNMLAGRDLQKKMGQTPQEVITVKLLTGLDGKNKMSKSLDNYIALNDSPNNMYGKLMSIPDSLIVEYFTLCTDVETKAIEIIEQELKENKRNPRDIKAELAKLITETYCGGEAAENAEAEFNRVYKNKENPENINDVKVEVNEAKLDDLLVELQLASSKSEARRLIEQGGVEVNNNKIIDPATNITLEDGMVVQVGKRRFARIKKL
jgi:tyrosyl-tRNA synthetase